MKFDQIVAIDPCGLTGDFKDKIFALSRQNPVIFDSYPSNNNEIIIRIGKADCVLVSWNTKIDTEVIRACPSIKYIGMCCSLYDEESANVDISEAKKQGIVVKGVRDYGDNGTVEFIFAELISLMKGLGDHQWLDEPTELTGKTIGIIGMGVLGKMVASTALHFGMNVLYHSRSRKPEYETDRLQYTNLHTLLSSSHIITTHVPRNSIILGDTEFSAMQDNTIFINTSLGQPFETEPFLKWLDRQKGNFAIFDSAGYGILRDSLRSRPNALLFERSSGFTREAKYRLTQKVWENMTNYLEEYVN